MRFSYLLIFLLGYYLPTQAQTKQVKGIYVTLNGDSVETTFILPVSKIKVPVDDLYNTYNSTKFKGYEPNLKRFKERIKIINELGNKEKIMASKTKSFSFSLDSTSYSYFSSFPKKKTIDPFYKNYWYKNYSWTYTTDTVFMQLVVNGPIKLFKYYMGQLHSGYNTNSYFFQKKQPYFYYINKLCYCLQKEGEDFFIYRKLFFKDDMKKYIEECAYLYVKIDEGSYKERDIVKIVTEYNQIMTQRAKLNLTKGQNQ